MSVKLTGALFHPPIIRGGYVLVLSVRMSAQGSRLAASGSLRANVIGGGRGADRTFFVGILRGDFQLQITCEKKTAFS